jgi:hypothetical protein
MNTAPTTQTGYVNRNGQVTIRNTDLAGNDHLQHTYQLACSLCGHNYGSNGSDLRAEVSKTGVSGRKARSASDGGTDLRLKKYAESC